MAHFYLDNDVSVRLARLLRADAHLVTLAKDQHATRAHDEQQLLTALDLTAILVTHNYRDFVLLHRAWHLWAARWNIYERHPPILVLPQGPEPALFQYLMEIAGSTVLPRVGTLHRYRVLRGWVQDP